MLIQKESTLAVIGGGRWGQVILSILRDIPISFQRVVVVSQFNARDINTKLEEWKFSSSTPFSLTHSIENLLLQYDVKAAIVVNSATQHFYTAFHLINNGIHVLIEKPIALSLKQMNILIEQAKKKEVCIFPGLCYRYCSYLDNFAKKITETGAPYSFIMKWYDRANEIRYGTLKGFDTTIDIAQDVMPHVWTILSKTFQHPLLNVNTCLSDDMSDDDANFGISLNNIAGQVILKRNAVARERSILVNFENNKFLKIDFSIEPGTVFENAEARSADIFWNNKLSPLTQQLNQFFSTIQTKTSTQKEIEACLHSVICSESASILLKKRVCS